MLVGMHGADLTNAWLMRPGSSVVEVLPYQFKDASFSYQNAKVCGAWSRRDKGPGRQAALHGSSPSPLSHCPSPPTPPKTCRTPARGCCGGGPLSATPRFRPRGPGKWPSSGAPTRGLGTAARCCRGRRWKRCCSRLWLSRATLGGTSASSLTLGCTSTMWWGAERPRSQGLSAPLPPMAATAGSGGIRDPKPCVLTLTVGQSSHVTSAILGGIEKQSSRAAEQQSSRAAEQQSSS